MAIKDDVYESIDEVLEELKLDIDFDDDSCLLDIIDSMSVLEVLLSLEDKGYDIMYIVIDKLGTVGNLIELLGEE